MDYLIIFDLTGKIWHMDIDKSDDPQGLLFIRAHVPRGKYAISVDAPESDNPIVVLGDLPTTEEQQMRADIDYLLLLQEVVYGRV